MWTKAIFDGLNRGIANFLSYPSGGSDDGDTTTDFSTDIVVEQEFKVYDAASNVTASQKYMRFHDATGQGLLSNPSGSQPLSRVYYICLWQDGIGRMIASADYGTNGGTPVTRPATIPTASDTVLVSLTAYDDSGNVASTTDPQGTVTTFEYDALARLATRIDNFLSGGGGSDVNKTTNYTYAPDGGIATLTLINATTGNQVTTWQYGTTLSTSAVATSNLLDKKTYPSGPTDCVTYAL